MSAYWMVENLLATSPRRPVYDRFLRRKHHMPLDPPTDAEKRDAILILRGDWIVAGDLYEEASRIFEEASQ